MVILSILNGVGKKANLCTTQKFSPTTQLQICISKITIKTSYWTSPFQIHYFLSYPDYEVPVNNTCRKSSRTPTNCNMRHGSILLGHQFQPFDITAQKTYVGPTMYTFPPLFPSHVLLCQIILYSFLCPTFISISHYLPHLQDHTPGFQYYSSELFLLNHKQGGIILQ
jgi:hypothetical protein